MAYATLGPSLQIFLGGGLHKPGDKAESDGPNCSPDTDVRSVRVPCEGLSPFSAPSTKFTGSTLASTASTLSELSALTILGTGMHSPQICTAEMQSRARKEWCVLQVESATSRCHAKKFLWLQLWCMHMQAVSADLSSPARRAKPAVCQLRDTS
jgi:hypothetical protein